MVDRRDILFFEFKTLARPHPQHVETALKPLDCQYAVTYRPLSKPRISIMQGLNLKLKVILFAVISEVIELNLVVRSFRSSSIMRFSS